MKSRTITMGMDVRGCIHSLQKKRPNAKTYMTDGNGKSLTRDEAINLLMDELAKGRESIPMDKHCANPCRYTSCPGFDYGPKGGCGGHITGHKPLPVGVVAGAPVNEQGNYYAPDGTLMNADGTRSIFDDVDE